MIGFVKVKFTCKDTINLLIFCQAWNVFYAGFAAR